MTAHAQSDPVPAAPSYTDWHVRFTNAVRFVLAPLILFLSGFFTADFILGGAYTWPRTSRVVVLSITLLVLTYEFIYKEQQLRFPDPSDGRPLKAVLYSCVMPYAAGVLLLLVLARLL
jgi:hypothetical protein